MFHSLFNPENTFFRFTGRVLDIVVLSTLWLVCSLPIITIGPATAALYYSCVKCLRRKQPEAYRSFFSAFRENLKTGIGATAVFLLLWELLAVGYLLLMMVGAPGDTVWSVVRLAYLLLLLTPLAVMSCAFPLLSRFTCNVRELLSGSLRMTFRHLPSLLAVAALHAALIYVTCVGWYFCMMLLTPALGALLASFLLEPVFRKYTPGAETSEADEDDEADGTPWYLR